MIEWAKVAKENGIKIGTYKSRIRRGWSQEKACSTPVNHGRGLYRHWMKVAESNGIKNGTYRSRVDELGWSKEEAATTLPRPLKKRMDRHWIKTAEENGISRNVYIYRVDEQFWDPEEASTAPITPRKEIVRLMHEVKKDYLDIQNDKIFNDLNNLYQITPQHIEEAEKRGIPELTFKSRVYQYGWTIQEALKVPVKKYDYSNEYFYWLNAALKNGISRDVYYKRVARGWDFEKSALTGLFGKGKRYIHCEKAIDLANRNGISYATYTKRRSLGWTEEEATTIPILKDGEYKDEEAKQRSRDGFKKFRTGLNGM